MRSATIANYLDPWHPSSHCGSFISINHPATLHRSQDVKQGPEAGRLPFKPDIPCCSYVRVVRPRPIIGHAHVTDTYWYLQATPILMVQIAAVSETLHRGSVP